MFFNWENMQGYGYQPVQKFFSYGKKSCADYYKVFPNNFSIVVFSTIEYNTLDVIFLSAEDYKTFLHDRSLSEIFKKYKIKRMFDGQITRKSKFESVLKKSEDLAKSKILIRNKLIEI